MKRFIPILIVLCLTLLLCSLSFADINQFTGRWVNTDSQTRGITALEITANGNSVWVQAWGQCHPQDCNWGKVIAYAYAPDVQSNLHSSAQAISAIFQTNFSQTLLIIKPVGNNELQAEVFTRFTDKSGRSNYTDTYTFHRQLKPIQPPQTMQPPHFGLVAPKQVSPASGSVFNFYPRKTTLHWSPVNGASSYTVEIDCFGCAKAGSWSSDVGQPWQIIPNINGTTYTFNFVGAQPGRWRVWAVGPNGQEGQKSPWWEFRYTK